MGNNAGKRTTTGDAKVIVGHGSITSASGDNQEIVIGTGQTGKGSSTGFINPNGGGMYQGNNSASWSTVSDRRIKKNIVDNNIGLDKINKIQIKNFEYRTEDEITDFENPKSAVAKKEGIQLGVIAQEIETILPELVKTESNGVKTVDPSNLTWYLINAIKELKARIEVLEDE